MPHLNIIITKQELYEDFKRSLSGEFVLIERPYWFKSTFAFVGACLGVVVAAGLVSWGIASSVVKDKTYKILMAEIDVAKLKADLASQKLEALEVSHAKNLVQLQREYERQILRS